MKSYFLLFTFSLFTLISCQSKISPRPVTVLGLKELSDLATTEYIVTKIIKTNDNKTWFKIGDRKILMSCKASIIAGIDFSLINQNDVVTNNNSIKMYLPHAKLISINIKPEDIKTEYEDISSFRSSFSESEKNDLAIQGQNNIKNSVDSLGVLKTAEVNATLFLSSYLQKLGYTNIAITFGAPPAILK